jgi:Flp pilus assembly protein TadD
MCPEQMQFAVDAALSALRLGYSAEAIRYARQALNHSPSDPELMSNLAIALLIGAETSQAEMLSKQAVKLNPSDKVTRRVHAVSCAVAAKKYPAPKNEAEVIQIAERLKL